MGVIGQQAQASVEDAHALVSNENIEEQMQASVNGGETFAKTNVFRIEVELQKTIDKIQEQEVVAPK